MHGLLHYLGLKICKKIGVSLLSGGPVSAIVQVLLDKICGIVHKVWALKNSKLFQVLLKTLQTWCMASYTI